MQIIKYLIVFLIGIAAIIKSTDLFTEGACGIAVGNAIGSCIANIGLILSIAAIARPIKLKPRFIRQESTFLIIVSLLVYIFMLNHFLNRFEGIILLVIVCAFFIYIVLRERRTSDNTIIFKKDTQPGTNLSHCIFKFLIGAVGVVLSARYAIIPSGLNIARYLGVPEIVIGLSIFHHL